MHKNNTFYIPAFDFYNYFEEFCKSNSYNKKEYLDEINKFVINKTINKRNYKTTQFLLDVEKKMSDLMMDLFYNKKFRINESELLEIITEFEQSKSPPLLLSELQKNAVINSILNKFYIINGLPGTGKSTIVECILFVFETLNKKASDSTYDDEEDYEDDNEDDTTISSDSDEDPIVFIKKCKYPQPKNIGLLAPTGLAYIGLKNKCMKTNPPFNMDISGTCHRVMYVQFPQIMNLKKGYGDYKGKKSKNMDSLEGVTPELLIIDEFSMIDSFMFKEILEWCRRFDCRLLILGDENQLPSIGPGCNLKNILECLLFSQTKLTDIKRQTGVLMNNIKKMTTEEITRDDFIDKTMCLVDIDHFIESDENDSNQINYDNLKTLIRKEGLTKDNTKFISYFKDEKYLFNVINLNNKLQNIFNPSGELIVSKSKFKDKFKFKVGDIVIRTDNDYTGDDIKANGEQSIVKSYDYHADLVILEKIGEKGVEEKIDIQTLYSDFNLAYALTVHKSQGSQYDNVVVIIEKNNKTWDKCALYTAVSRARDRCFVVSKEKDFMTAQRSMKNLTDKISLFMKVSDTYEFS
jgi:ATP-dependent exoDNAse (exonuclease V) alpha subunit